MILMSKEIWFSAVFAITTVIVLIFATIGENRTATLFPEHIHRKSTRIQLEVFEHSPYLTASTFTLFCSIL